MVALTTNASGQLSWGSFSGAGDLTEVQVGTGLTVTNGTGPIPTVSLGTELAAINGLATTGFVKRTGAGAYSTSSSIDLSADVGATVLPLANGGTSKALTAANGGIIYSDADSMEVLAATATAGQILRSGANSAPSWSTATYPATATTAGTFLRADGTNWVASGITLPNSTTANRLLFSSAANTVGEIAVGTNNQVLKGVTGGAPVFGSLVTADLPAGTATGTGTTNAIPKYTDGANAVIGNSNLSDSGTLITAAVPAQINNTGAAGTGGELRLRETSVGGNTQYVGFRAPDSLAANNIYVMPNAFPGSNQYLMSDASGNLSWSSPAGAGDITDVTVSGNGLSVANSSGPAPDISLNAELQALSQLATTGFVKRTGVATYSTSSSINLAADVGATILPLANGGSSKALTAANGGIVWTDADSMEVLAAGTSGYILTSGGAGSPAWTQTLPITNGGTGTTNGSITGSAALTFTAGGANSNINLVPTGTGTVDVGGKKITSLADPTAATDAATRGWVLANLLSSETDPQVGAMNNNRISKWNGTALVDSNLSDDGTTVSSDKTFAVNNGATSGGSIRVLEDSDNGANYVAIKSPDTLGSDITLTLPTNIVDGGYLTTNASGQLSWGSPSGAGDLTEVQVGTGLTVTNGTGPIPTVSLGTELAAINGLATTGFVKRTGAGAYSTSAISLTADISGVLPLANGGTNKNMTAANGGIIYSDADSMEVLAATATAGQILRSGANSAPSWSTATYPATATTAGTFLRADGTNWAVSGITLPNSTTANRLLFSSAANTVGEIAVGTNNQVLKGVTAGAPVFGALVAADLPSGTASGTGTTNAIPKYTNGGSAILGDSNLTDSGTLVTSAVPVQINNVTTTGGTITLRESSTGGATRLTGFRAPSDLTGGADSIYTMPAAYPGSNQYLMSDASGNLSWSSPAGAGDLTEVQVGTGLTVTNGTGPIPTVSLGTELAAINGLATTGFVKRTGAGAYSTSAISLTADISGVLPLANGGTNKNMTAANGGIVWTDADSMEVIAAGTAGYILTSGGAGSPAWTDLSTIYVKRDGSSSMSGDWDLNGATAGGTIKITGLADPTASDGAVNKGYADTTYAASASLASYVKRDGTTALTGNWDVGNYYLTNLASTRIGSAGAPSASIHISKSVNTGNSLDPGILVANTSTATHSNAGVTVQGNNGTVSGALLADGLGTSNVIGGTSTGVALGTETSHPLVFYTALAERLKVDADGGLQFTNLSTSSVSESGKAKIYYDTEDNKLKVSYNGAAYADLAGASGGGVTTMTAVGSSPNANGATISGTDLTLQPADATNPGVVTAGTQTIAGAKTFNSQLTVSSTTVPQQIVTASSGNVRLDLRRPAGTDVTQLLFGTAAATDYQIGEFADSKLQIRSVGTPANGITLDGSNGSVGIGTSSPKGAAAVAQAIDVGTAGQMSSLQLGTDGSFMGFNIYYNGGWKYKGNGTASFLREDNTEGLQFAVAPSNSGGTDAAASPIYAMRINPSGAIALGGLNLANEPLEVGGSGRAFFGNGAGASRSGLLIDGDEGGATYARIESYKYGTGGIPLQINPNGGAVGIGNAVPTHPLDVTTATTYSTMRLKNTSQAAATAFSVLPWNGTVYLSAGARLDNGTWVLDNTNSNNSQLLVMQPGTGVRWYASDSATPNGNWTIASNVGLWNAAGAWVGPIASSSMSGTTTYIPKFTTANTVGNSSISDNGSVVNIANLYFNVGNKRVVDANDSWLRLNQAADFTSGTHIPYNLNAGANGGVTVGGNYYAPGNGILHVQNQIMTTGGGGASTDVLIGTAVSNASLVTNRGSLGTNQNDSLNLSNIGFKTGNSVSLGVKAIRRSAGADWTSTTLRIGPDVDNSPNIYGAGIRFDLYDGSIKIDRTIAGASATDTDGSIDFSSANAISTSYDCTNSANEISLNGLRSGGVYTLVVTGTGTARCQLNTSVTGIEAATVTYKFQNANAGRIASKHTVYTFMRVGDVVYVSWAPGFN
ncbi:MAG: hypothetical protein IPM57_06710 [Oligoflexia bacterium]|nr:hypothetical protein [Oligoflexia bacterium]